MSRRHLAAFISVAGLLLTLAAGVVLRARTQEQPDPINTARAEPSYIVANTPTAVTFLINFSHSTEVPSRVNLLYTDATGRQTLGVSPLLHDDGVNGDVQAGDRVFSHRLVLNQNTIGERYFRVGVTYGNATQRSLSNVVVVHVDPFALPPDPGEAGEQTLQGIDSDHDGVRDDVERYIALTFPTSTDSRRALQQLAVAMQVQVNNDGQVSDVTAASSAFAAGIDCLMFVRGMEQASDDYHALRSIVLNTSARSRAWTRLQQAFSGHTFSVTSREELGDRCDFSH